MVAIFRQRTMILAMSDDIQITHINRGTRVLIQPLTQEGERWIRANIDHPDREPAYTINEEYLNETLAALRLAGLTVKE